MAENHVEILKAAVNRNIAAELSLPSAGLLHNCKSRFLSELEGGILLELPRSKRSLVDELIASQRFVGVSFKSGREQLMFTSRIGRVLDLVKVNEKLTADAIWLEFPAEVTSMQRRATNRVDVPPESELSLRVWRINARWNLKQQPPAEQEVKTELRNLSIGGLGVRFVGSDSQPPVVSAEDRLRIILTYEGHELLLEGRICSLKGLKTAGILAGGIEFEKLERDMEGRKILAHLTRIVGELQRDEVRRMRLGLLKCA